MEEPSHDNGTTANLIDAEQKEQGADFLTLPAFRMMCLSNPLLDTFFHSQLPASFKLETPHRTNINGTSIWHDVQPASATANSGAFAVSSSSTSSTPASPGASSQKSASAPPAATSFFNAITAATSPSPSSSSGGRAYSKDVSTGVVGRIGGFLNNFLGEDVKSKVDDLADSLGERLNTKVVRGPLPSFANLDNDPCSPFSVTGRHGQHRSSSGVATMGMDDIRAVEEERMERRRVRELEEQQEEARAMQSQGIDINAAQKSLRLATEAIVEGAQTGGKQFGDDVPVLSDTSGAGEEGEEEEEVVIVEDEAVHLPKA